MFGTEYFEQGKHHASKGEWSTALAYFEYAISLAALPDEVTGHEKEYSTLALYYNQASHASFQQHLLKQARDYTVESINLCQRLPENEQDNRRVLAFYYNNLGNIDCAGNESDAVLRLALKSYAAAISCMDAVIAEQTTDEDNRNLAMYFYNCANIYFALGDRDSAKKNYLQAFHYQNQIIETIPDEDDYTLTVYQNSVAHMGELQPAAEKAAQGTCADLIHSVKIQDDVDSPRHQLGDLKQKVSVLECSLFYHPAQETAASSLDSSWWLVEDDIRVNQHAASSCTGKKIAIGK